VTEKTRFYELSIPERRTELAKLTGLTEDEVNTLSGEPGLDLMRADHMVENAIGVFSLPIGIAQNFLINGHEVLIPMVIEEPSVIAGASFMAKLARATGGFTCNVDPPEMVGQMQILDIQDPRAAIDRLIRNKANLLTEADDIDPVLKKLGGGAKDIEVRTIKESPIGTFLVMDWIYDVRDAMGANAVNTAMERMAEHVEAISGGRVLLRILSNLADRRLVRANCTIKLDLLSFKDFSAEQVRNGIIAAWAFAAVDPHRAATHNKGIMNGVDAVVIATGNDWRAVEAGAHAYAARSGTYKSLSTWSKDSEGNLVGSLEIPMAVGIIGGATRVHPGAQAALKLMNVKTSGDLAEIIGAVGLAQNLAALRALATEGIQQGHMTLHARQVAAAAGAIETQIPAIAEQMIKEKNVRIDRAIEILQEWNQKNHD
jgi:hydroxymethylglutaryl-CoA reductase